MDNDDSKLDASAALVGDPVDPRRPEHMSRKDYLKEPPGHNTAVGLKAAGLVKRHRRNRRLAIVTAVVGALALVALLL